MSFHFVKTNSKLTAGELLKEHTNIYRTKDYIVKQRISLCEVADGNSFMISDDTFYLRTPERDSLFEKIFASKRRNINGKRMKTAIYTRQYVE